MFSNPSGLKSVFEKLRFLDGLIWAVGPTVEKSCVLKFLPRSVDKALELLGFWIKSPDFKILHTSECLGLYVKQGMRESKIMEYNA